MYTQNSTLNHASHPPFPIPTSFLVFEYWALPDPSLPPETNAYGDGLMVVSKGIPAQGNFQDGAQTLTITTLDSALPLPSNLAHADWASFEIARPFQMVNVPVGHSAWAGSHAWFAGVQNVAVWSVGNVSYAMRYVCGGGVCGA